MLHSAPPSTADQAAPPPGMKRVLLLDRDAESLSLLRGRLQQAGYGVTALADSNQALQAVEREQPDLVMLDWDIPGVAPADLVGRMRRSNGAKGPRVLLMSMLAAEPQILAGFEAGADDYVVKPFSLAEIMARVRALLRSVRREDTEGHVIRFQELQICGHDFRLTIDGKPVALRGSEYRLLEFLVRHPERAFTRAQLLDRVWGRDASAEERAIDVTVQRLRKALSRHACEQYIQTVRGVGYRISSANAAREPFSPID
jgi:two-component system phosphate regulon response regulator PhoB